MWALYISLIQSISSLFCCTLMWSLFVYYLCHCTVCPVLQGIIKYWRKTQTAHKLMCDDVREGTESVTVLQAWWLISKVSLMEGVDKWMGSLHLSSNESQLSIITCYKCTQKYTRTCTHVRHVFSIYSGANYSFKYMKQLQTLDPGSGYSHVNRDTCVGCCSTYTHPTHRRSRAPSVHVQLLITFTATKWCILWLK